MRSDLDQLSWVGTRSAMELLGVSRQRLYQLEREGKINGKMVDGRYLWNQRSIEARIALMERENREYATDGDWIRG